jgi:hypothetical protein
MDNIVRHRVLGQIQVGVGDATFLNVFGEYSYVTISLNDFPEMMRRNGIIGPVDILLHPESKAVTGICLSDWVRRILAQDVRNN